MRSSGAKDPSSAQILRSGVKGISANEGKSKSERSKYNDNVNFKYPAQAKGWIERGNRRNRD